MTFDFTTSGDRAHDERYKITLVDPRKMQYMVKLDVETFLRRSFHYELTLK